MEGRIKGKGGKIVARLRIEFEGTRELTRKQRAGHTLVVAFFFSEKK